MKKLIFLFFLILAVYLLSDKISYLQSKYISIVFGENEKIQTVEKKEENQENSTNIEKTKSKDEEKTSFIEKLEENIKIIKEKILNLWRKE